MLWTRISDTAESLSIDRAEQRLVHHGRTIALSSLPWRLLLALIDRPGQLITRAELKCILWPHAARIDTERRLNTAMRALRTALDETAESPRFIATVRGHGYRWIGARPGASAPRSPRRWAMAALAVLVVASTSPIAVRPAVPVAAVRQTATSDMLRAQASVDAWRNQPTAARLDHAARDVAAASAAVGEHPALFALEAELAIGGRWDWAGAERLYRRALALDPRHVDARLGLAWLEVDRGRRAEAVAIVEGVIQDLVLTDGRRANLGWLLLRAGRPDLAADACRDPAAGSINTLSCEHSALAELADFDGARSPALALMDATGAEQGAIDSVAKRPPRAAYAEFLQWRAKHFLPDGAPWFQQAQVLADAGLVQASLDRLERAIHAREPLAVKIASTPSFAAFGDDPRYRTMLRAVGLGG